VRPSVAVTLKTPVEVGGKTIREVTVTKPRVRELRLAGEAAKDKGGIEETRQLLAQCTGIIPADLDAFEVDDFTACAEALQGLMGEA
jgi:hypothetical protein